MYLALDPRERALQAQLRELLAKRQPEERVRELMDDSVGDDPALWADLLALTGDRRTAVDHAVVLEVLGETLYVGPYLSSVVRAGLFVPEAAAGEVRATVVDAPLVLDGMTAGQFVVPDGDTVTTVDASEVTRAPVGCLDQTRKLARVDLSGSSSPRLHLVTLAAVAASQVGTAQAALHAALTYVRERRQFGRTVGSYQSIKHALADVALAVEQARAAAYHAAWTLDARPAEAEAAVAHARIVCTQSALQAAEACMQFRGGQGFRWDNTAHLYLKRAKADQLLFGDPAAERQRLAELLQLV